MIQARPMDAWAKSILQRIGHEDAMAASRKKTYYISQLHVPMDMPSFWDGGSKSYWDFYKPSTREHVQMPSNHPWFEAGRPYTMTRLPDDCIVVRTGISCGKPSHAHFYVQDALELQP